MIPWRKAGRGAPLMELILTLDPSEKAEDIIVIETSDREGNTALGKPKITMSQENKRLAARLGRPGLPFPFPHPPVCSRPALAPWQRVRFWLVEVSSSSAHENTKSGETLPPPKGICHILSVSVGALGDAAEYHHVMP